MDVKIGEYIEETEELSEEEVLRKIDDAYKEAFLKGKISKKISELSYEDTEIKVLNIGLEEILKEYIELMGNSNSRKDDYFLKAFLLKEKTIERMSQLDDEDIKVLITSLEKEGTERERINMATEWFENGKSLKEVERFVTDYNKDRNLWEYRQLCVYHPFNYEIEERILKESDKIDKSFYPGSYDDIEIASSFRSMYEKNKILRRNLAIISAYTGRYYALFEEDLLEDYIDKEIAHRYPKNISNIEKIELRKDLCTEDFNNLMNNDEQRENCMYIIQRLGLDIPEEILQYVNENKKTANSKENDIEISPRDIAEADKETALTTTELGGIKGFIKKILDRFKGKGEK